MSICSRTIELTSSLKHCIVRMEELTIVVTDEQKREIRNKINITEDNITEAIGNILDWFKKEQHLPRINLDPRIIECILIARKGSVEQTKKIADMMYTIRNVIPELSAPRDILCDKFKNAFKGGTFIYVPKLNHDLTRIGIMKYKDPIFFNVVDTTNFVFTLFEYRLVHDYFAGERYIVDMKGFTIGHLTKYTPTNIKNFELCTRNAYGFRISGIHIINGNSLINKAITAIKAGLSEKIGSRLYAHETYDELYKYIDKEILPREYGGSEKSSEEILDNWIKELSKDTNREYLIKLENQKSNEALRIGTKLDDEILGIPGTFRKLNVD